MTCLLKIKSSRESMSASEKKLADFILDNAQLLRDYSSQQFAEAVGVSQSSVVKFSQKLGYKGYPDLKMAVSEGVAKLSTEMSLHGLPNDALESAPLIDKLLRSKLDALASTSKLNDESEIINAANLLKSAKRIQLAGLGGSLTVAKNFSYKLVSMGKSVFSDSDSTIQLTHAMNLGKDDILFAVSASGQTADIVQMIKFAKAAGAKVISITKYKANQISLLSDVKLYTVADQELQELSLILVRTAQQHLLDMLFIRLLECDNKGRKAREQSKKSMASLKLS